MRKFLTLALAVLATSAMAQVPADALLKQALGTAKSSHKNVFVRFTASWCGWCQKMQGVLDQKEVKPIWDKYFVSTAIVVLENGDKEKNENPGGEALMEANGGKNQGIPFFYFIDGQTGKPIVNSLMPPVGTAKAANVGCPYEPNEIEFFMQLLKKSAPKMSEDERGTIRKAFESLKKAG
ncbi:MAG TPA: thioredoxin family protein [Fimbriimonadaceae bacterium]|nr:thioredoxin family protein [Fimbriimonadaceae bacterium]